MKNTIVDAYWDARVKAADTKELNCATEIHRLSQLWKLARVAIEEEKSTEPREPDPNP